MPTYEYECTKCGDRFERFQAITDKPVKHCPTCRGKVRKLIGTGAGIIFKGTGFYATDYRRASHGGKAQREKGEGGPDSAEERSKRAGTAQVSDSAEKKGKPGKEAGQ
ncbi:MAG: zinc ribbon domain-containing protein [Kiritimatiellae bacterium]|nr:zinc ribbon domain-containing protein [Kiritimatiellia bacterium]